MRREDLMETTRKFELDLTEPEHAMLQIALAMLQDELDAQIKRAERLEDVERLDRMRGQLDAAESAVRKLSAASWPAH